MNKDQSTGILERLAYAMIMAVLMKLVAKGYIDEDMATYVASGIIAAGGAVWAWWINRPKALIQSAAAQPGTTVLTTPDIAHATPEVNILPSDKMKVTTK